MTNDPMAKLQSPPDPTLGLYRQVPVNVKRMKRLVAHHSPTKLETGKGRDIKSLFLKVERRPSSRLRPGSVSNSPVISPLNQVERSHGKSNSS